jgi:outer membrane protein assembly factor BamB
MRVKKILSHSSCILYIGFFTNNDEEHFYSLSNNGELKEWLLNPDGSILLLETSYLLRPGSEYLDYIGYPPTENTSNGHNIIISTITVADNLLFCGYEDGLVLVWRQERRDVVDNNIIKSWKRSRTIIKSEKEDYGDDNSSYIRDIINKESQKENNVKNIEIEEKEEEEEKEDENENENENDEENESKINKSNLESNQSNNVIIVTESKKNLALNSNNDINTSQNKKLDLYKGPTMSKKYKKYIDIENMKKAYKENFVREGKYRIDDIILFNLKDDLIFYKSSMVDEFKKMKDEVVIGENDYKYKFKNYSNIFWLKYLFINQTQEISYLFYYNYKDNHILLSASKNGSIMCYNIDNGNLLYSFNVTDYVKYACFCKEVSKNKKVTKTHLTLLCNSPHKIILNLTQEKPINMNTYDFKYNDFTKIIFNNNNFYLLGKRGECIVFNNKFEEEQKVFYRKSIPLYDIIQYNKKFLLFTSEFNMCLVEFDFEKKKIIELFYIKFGMNKVTNLIYINDVLYITNADKNIYCIDFNYDYRLYEERIAMKKEELLSAEYNIYYELHKNKKKKKKKGKKGKGGKKKSASPAKKKK